MLVDFDVRYNRRWTYDASICYSMVLYVYKLYKCVCVCVCVYILHTHTHCIYIYIYIYIQYIQISWDLFHDFPVADNFHYVTIQFRGERCCVNVNAFTRVEFVFPLDSWCDVNLMDHLCWWNIHTNLKLDVFSVALGFCSVLFRHAVPAWSWGGVRVYIPECVRSIHPHCAVGGARRKGHHQLRQDRILSQCHIPHQAPVRGQSSQVGGQCRWFWNEM